MYIVRAAKTTDAHPCAVVGCKDLVTYDDEPYCYTHSPDIGSHEPGYSYKKSNLPK